VLAAVAAVYDPPDVCSVMPCASTRLGWFEGLAVFFLLPGVLGGAGLSVAVHWLLYGTPRLPRPGWLPRLVVIAACVVGALAGVLSLTG
jgi:hypothetical protein